MTTLFESLQRKLGEQPAAAPAPQQQTVEDVLRAKSGKATGGTGPKASSLGEQTALDQATSAQQQQGQAGQLQGAALGQQAAAQEAQTATAQRSLATQQATQAADLASRTAITAEDQAARQSLALQGVEFTEAQRVEQINATADQQLRALASERGTSVDNIFRDFKRSQQELVFRQDAARLEQLGHVLAMRDQAYVDELNRIGAERDLNDKISFREEMNRVVLGDQLSDLLDEQDFKRDLNANQRAWNYRLASIDAESAMAIAQSAIQDESRRQLVTGIGESAKAGIDIYGKQQQGAYNSDYQQYKESTDKPMNYTKWQDKQTVPVSTQTSEPQMISKITPAGVQS